MADMNTMLTNIAVAILNDSATQTWCTTTYGRKHKVFKGIDNNYPPAETDDPCVGVFLGSKSGGYEVEDIQQVVCVSCEIFNDDKTVTGDLIEYDGQGQIESFRQLVLAAVKGMTDANRGGRIDKVDTLHEPILFFPQFTCDMYLKITDDLYQGDDPIE